MSKSKQQTLADAPLSVVAQALEAGDKYSTQTMKTYRRHWARFHEFTGGNLTPKEVTFAILEEFREYVTEQVSATSARVAVDAVAALVKYADPTLLRERYRGNIRKLHHIRLDIADSDSAKFPGRLERVLKAITKAIKEEA